MATSVDFEAGTAEVIVARDWGFDLAQFAPQLQYDGYEILNVVNSTQASVVGEARRIARDSDSSHGEL